MGKVKIGVKFCGGCQSRYERGELYEKIKSEISDVNFEYALSDNVYDILLVISGCPIKCADIKKYKAKKIINVDSQNHKDAVNIVRENIK